MGDGSKKEIELTSQTTISDMLTTLKDQGLNANFDVNQQRFYISAKESGADGNFSFSGDADVLGALGLAEAPCRYFRGRQHEVCHLYKGTGRTHHAQRCSV